MEIEKKQKQKLAAIAIGMVVVIILLIVAIMAVTTNKSSQVSVISGTDNNEILIEESKPEEDVKKETKVSVIETVSTKTNTANEKMPETGPVDLLPLAIVLGLMTTGATAFAMNKRKI